MAGSADVFNVPRGNISYFLSHMEDSKKEKGHYPKYGKTARNRDNCGIGRYHFYFGYLFVWFFACNGYKDNKLYGRIAEEKLQAG